VRAEVCARTLNDAETCETLSKTIVSLLSYRIELLATMAAAIVAEVEELAEVLAFRPRDALIAEPIDGALDFYKEVESFEIDLIKRALTQTEGSQRRAARLLGINPTTLNAKLKHYGFTVELIAHLAHRPQADTVRLTDKAVGPRPVKKDFVRRNGRKKNATLS
jgi:transcriptional regulator with GAF, ATPase, and Fis domain